ncbi:hypothetical protein ACFS7Z_24240 [Pontibacter toksunensis]|uniref:DUF4359 domain-containing protein n=1 Tax=Pontibacter toksunensis TaxID=1332631 RepID=A0ABW6C1C0_9BACT
MTTLNQKPMLQQWLKENPGCSINDYFKEYGEPPIQSHIHHTSVATTAPITLETPSSLGFFITPLKLVLFTLMAVIGLMALTNPDDTRHKEVLKQELINAMGSESKAGEATKDTGYEALAEFAGRSIAMQFADVAVNSMVSVDNYVLFSLTNVTFDGFTNTIGVGVLGNVYVSRDLMDKVKEHMDK